MKRDRTALCELLRNLCLKNRFVGSLRFFLFLRLVMNISRNTRWKPENGALGVILPKGGADLFEKVESWPVFRRRAKMQIDAAQVARLRQFAEMSEHLMLDAFAQNATA